MGRLPPYLTIPQTDGVNAPPPPSPDISPCGILFLAKNVHKKMSPRKHTGGITHVIRQIYIDMAKVLFLYQGDNNWSVYLLLSDYLHYVPHY